MCIRWVAASCIVVLLAGSLLAFEAVGTIQKVDAENNRLSIAVQKRASFAAWKGAGWSCPASRIGANKG